VKDTLLTSLITFAITNKDQFRVFQSDYQEDEGNSVRTEIRDLLKTEL
jgi:UDP-glucose 4-epimerase